MANDNKIKLIIEIDKEQYEQIMEHKGGFYIDIFNNIRNGVPLEDIKVEMQNTILEQTYERGRNNVLEKIKTEIKQINLDLCDFPQSVVFKILDKHIKENNNE